MKRIFFIVVIIEIAAIVFLLTRNTTKKVVITPLSGKYYVFSKIGDIKLFNEPKPNTNLTNPTFWFPHPGLNTINSDTLNERYNYSLKKPDKTFRIITLGDSFTYGLYVNTQDNYPEQLENIFSQKLQCKQWKKVEVINLGVGGYDAEYSYYRYLKRGRKYSPDLVIWFLKSGDFDVIKKEQDKYTENYKKVIAQNPGLKKKYIAQKNYYPWVEMAKEDVTKVLGASTIISHQETIIKKLSKVHKGKLLFIAFPFLNKEYKDFLLSLSQSKKVYYHDTVDIYKYSNASLVDMHPNKKGYTIIANDLFSYIKREKIIPCDK